MRKLIVTAVLALTAAGCGRSSTAGRAVPPEQAARLLLDRNWLDRAPESKDDRLHVLRFVPQMGGGVYQDRTLFAGSFELFRFEHSGDQIRFDLLHTGTRATARYRIEQLAKGERPPFDLKLVLDGSPRGPSVYYGWSSERGDLDADLAKLAEDL